METKKTGSAQSETTVSEVFRSWIQVLFLNYLYDAESLHNRENNYFDLRNYIQSYDCPHDAAK